ncbi:hypothetical protein [Paenibacillus sp. SYP-B4298]|uniref:hypothetical protein n=1 Tax=Paenibacillus sp. SYP-B4298 TaxID=2996034 RepID=UPI0022DE1A4E|nr:hypothetical protein [Paenibacillus sp. SYP-B4298]
MNPTKGRVVYYRENGEEYAARVAFVNEDGTVNLAVDAHHGASSFGRQSISQGDADGQWYWPPRVQA